MLLDNNNIKGSLIKTTLTIPWGIGTVICQGCGATIYNAGTNRKWCIDCEWKKRNDMIRKIRRRTKLAKSLGAIIAKGTNICKQCNKEYWQHPYTEHRDEDGKMFITKLCDGTLVKC